SLNRSAQRVGLADRRAGSDRCELYEIVRLIGWILDAEDLAKGQFLEGDAHLSRFGHLAQSHLGVIDAPVKLLPRLAADRLITRDGEANVVLVLELHEGRSGALDLEADDILEEALCALDIRDVLQREDKLSVVGHLSVLLSEGEAPFASPQVPYRPEATPLCREFRCRC